MSCDSIAKRFSSRLLKERGEVWKITLINCPFGVEERRGEKKIGCNCNDELDKVIIKLHSINCKCIFM